MILHPARAFKRRLVGAATKRLRSSHDRGRRGARGRPRQHALRRPRRGAGRGCRSLAATVLGGRARDVLFRAGAPVERLLLLRSGRVRVSDPVLTSAGPGDTLGELALNEPTVHTATAHALEPVEGFALEVRDFDQLRAAGDPLAFTVLRRLSLLLAERIRAAGDGISPGADPMRPATPGPRAVDELPFLRTLPVLPGVRAAGARGARRLAAHVGARARRDTLRGGQHRPLRVRRLARRDRGDPRARRPPSSPGDGRAGPHARRALADRRRRADRDLRGGRALPGARDRTRRRREAAGRRLAGRARLPAGGEPRADRRTALDRQPANRRGLGGAARRGRGARPQRGSSRRSASR